MDDIKIFREQIDKINVQIIELLARRMEVAGEIAEYKRQHGLPIRVPEREKQVIENVKELARKSGLDEKMAEDVFWKIIERTRNGEAAPAGSKTKRTRLAVLGPAGTFSHEAALKFDKNAEMIFAESIWDVFESVGQGKADAGVVPVENSIEGGVGTTLDALVETGKKIKQEIIIPIRHCLCGFGEIAEIEEVYSHMQALGQCRNLLHGIGAKTIQTSSTAAAAEEVARMKDGKKACLCSKLAAEMYGLKIVKEDVHDEKNNMTRFFVISPADAEPTGNDKTSLAAFPQSDRPGLLYGILEIFSKRKINLTRIESRPSRRRLGEYIFFIDAEGHRKDKLINDALQQLEKDTMKVKIFGSYPKWKN